MLKNSKCSGKCCLEDTVEMRVRDIEHYEEDVAKFLKTCEIYTDMDENFHMLNKLNLETYKDILPYYPRCESIGCFGDGKATILLQRKPHWVYEEEEYFEWILKEVLRVYNKYKRNKISFTAQDLYNESKKRIGGFFSKDEEIREISKRVFESGKKATIEGLRKDLTNRLYREPLIAEMVRVGYSESEATEWAYNNNKTWKEVTE